MNKNRTHTSSEAPKIPTRQAGQRGFTLLEMMIAVSLMALLFTGVMALFIAAARTSVRTQAQVYATNDAANSIQRVVADLREAQSFALPTSVVTAQAEEGWITLSGTTLSQFATTYNTETINTAIQMTTPPALIGSANGYTQAGVTQIKIQNSTGTISVPVQPYQSDGMSSTTAFLYYRGDADGTPDADPTGSSVANAGTYFWRYSIPSSQAFVLDVAHGNPFPICKSVSIAPNAVQFVRPAYNNVPEKWQVELKIISGYYSPINGTQTIEGGSGISQLSGKCVYMRDHSTTGAPHSARTQGSNNAFQHS